MKLNPKQAPLYGECVLTVQLGEEECVEDEEDVEFYLLFSGSTQRHLTTTLRIGHVTLQAVCPAHDRDETVRVTLCQARPGGSVDSVAEDRFQFVQDLALDMAHFLVSAAAHRGGLEGALLLSDSHTPEEECEILDETLMLALKHLPLPPGWSVLGPDLNTHSPADFSPHETLLHFAARRGLRRVALFLLQQSGGPDALQLPNRHGHTPARVAQSRGHTQLQHLLSELENLPHLERRAVRYCSAAGRVFQHHPKLNTFSLTVKQETDGDPPDLRRDVEELRHYAYCHKAGSRTQLRSVPLILSRDFICKSHPAAVTPSEDASLHVPPAFKHQEVEKESERSEKLNGGVLSEEVDVPASKVSSDPGNGTVGLEVEGVCVEGVCVEERKNSAAVSTVSCGDQQQEEVDSEPRVIREAPRSNVASERKTHNNIQSGNLQKGTMGQTQGLLPEREERNKARGDLPEEREGERNSEQETFWLSEKTQLLHGQKDGEKRSWFYRHLNVTTSENAKELQIQETGNASERIHESAGCTAQNPDVREDLDSPSFRPNMTPGPVHNVRLEPSPGVQQLLDVSTGDQIDAPPETPYDCSEQASSDSVKDPLPCDEVTDAPDRLLPDVSLTAEESSGKIRIDQLLLPEIKKSSSPGSESDVQPVVSPETSEETSQILTKSHCGGEELSQEHGESQILDATHPDSERSQCPLLVLDPMSAAPSEILVSDFCSEEAENGFQSKLEKELQAFQTPPESPCEFFSVDGFNGFNMTFLELGTPAGSQHPMEKGGKVETELLEMCESFKKSPVTVLCGSFSKLTIRGSPLNPQLHSTASETIEKTTDDLETSKTLSSELEETNKEVMKLEPELVKMCDSSGTSAEPLSDPLAEENFRGTAAITQNDQPLESKDVQEALMKMKMPTQLGENLDSPCGLLSLTTSVLKNITHPPTELMTLKEGDKTSETSEDTQPELMTSTETMLETSPNPNLEVRDFKENILEHPEVMTSEESKTRISLDLYHDLITSSEETIGETSPDPLPEFKIFEDSVQDQQLKVMISEESITGTILGPDLDFTSSVETIRDVSLGPLLEVSSSEKSLQVHQHEKSRNDSLDLKDELESNKGTHEFHHELITPSEEMILESFCGPLSEENVLNQQPEVLNTEESIRGTSLELTHDLPVSLEETVGPCSEENIQDQQHEVMTCENSINGTSQDPEDHDKAFEVTTSENSFKNPHHEVTIGETASDQQPEIKPFEENIRYSPDHIWLQETTVEDNLRTSLEPPAEVMCTNMDACLSEAPVKHETVILDPLESCSDSCLALEDVSISGLHKIPEQMVDLNVGSGLDIDSSSAVEVDSGLIRDLPSSESVANHKSGNLEQEKSPTEEEHREEHAADEEQTEREKRKHSQQIHREEDEVLYSLHSEDLEEKCSKENTETDVAEASVCRSVSASSLPVSESVSDGDSLLGPDVTDDTIFRQSEDTLTLTSGISMTGSVSTDDSSITHAVGETEEEEKKDRLTEVLERSTVLRPASRSHSPSRRHSWEPNKNQSGEMDMGQRSVVHVEEEEKAAGHRRSMSWCPSHVPCSETEEMNSRSYSLEGLADEGEVKMPNIQHSTHTSVTEREERGSLASLTEEENENNSQRSVQEEECGFVPPHTLTKSVSMSAISPKYLDAIGRARPKRRISFSFSVVPRLPKPKPLFAFNSSSSDEEEAGNLACARGGSMENSISEEDPAPLRSDSEVRVTKVSRTFSYLKSKMTKKSKEKDRDRNKDGKEKEKKSSNGHLFSPSLTPPPSPCLQCNRPISMKDALTCTNCSVHVHKGCRDVVPVCAKVKMKQQTVTDSGPPAGTLARGKSTLARERPWSTFLLPEDQTALPVPPPRKNTTIMPFNSSSLSKSISISNISGQSDEAPLKALKILSQSSDSLNKTGKVNESTESLIDEGAELMDSHLMVEFDVEVKELEADSWSFTVDKKYLKQLKKDIIKRQDVIYELLQTELHHMRTLRIMAEVYSKGLQVEVQVEVQTLEKMFPELEELLELHTHFLTNLLERRREEREEQRGGEGGFIIRRIGDVLLHQVTGSNAENMKKIYGKFCSRHNEAVNIYKELHTRDKRFQAFIKKKMSSAVVRRLSIPECILLVTQRITKYPVLLQRLLQHTREAQEEQEVAEALRQVKEVLVSVDSRVNEYEMRRRLKEVHSRTDSKSIMRMKSGQMFAREDLIRGRKLLHDGPLQLKNAAGRLKDVQALLLSDVFVFLQEKDQKYVFASLDQRSTVISLQKLIVREVANEERGLFFITAGIEKPEMVEVHASSKDERNTWMQLIQNATTSIDKDDDEGIPSENEEDKRLQESKAKDMRDQLQKKDEQIVSLLEEKACLFRELFDCTNQDKASLRNRMLFRATGDDVTKGEPIIRDALKEVETLQELVNSSVVGQQVCVEPENSNVCAASVSLPRRAETFGGFDCHQMNISKNGDREEADDLRRTESDSVLKKGATANLLLLHKRNSEQFLLSVSRLHDLLNTLQAVVVQQDTFIEEQRQALISPSLRHPSISSSSSISSLSSCSSRPSSLMEQEKQRQEEKIREEERRKREEDDRKRRREEEERRRREEELALREEKLIIMEEETQRRSEMLQQEQQELNNKKEELKRELLRLHNTQPDSDDQRAGSSSSVSEDSMRFLSFPDVAEGVEVFSRADSKRKAKNLNPFGQKGGAAETHGQIPNCLLQLAKARDKKEKKKKKGKGGQQSHTTDPVGAAACESSGDKDVFFC